MKVSILVVCVVASLANLVHAQDWALIRKSDEDCQYGLSCKKDMQVTQKDIEAHIANGGTQSQKVNSTGIQRCFSNWPLLPPRLNPEKRKIHDYGYQLCEGDNDCPDKSCLFGVCLVRPGAENAFCKGNDWLLVG
ncbi:hypothetical protein BGZ89_008414 [Linnemannia elongata]|nr:hypothetical protein BGZ89_008414 [Linnemannia elongata]